MFRKLLKDLAVYGGTDVLLKAVGFITLPIYTRVFSPEEYGVWAVVVAAAGVFGGVVGLGSDSAYARYFFEARTEEERQRVTSTWFLFLAGWSLALTALLLPLTGLMSRWMLGSPGGGALVALALLAVPVGLLNSMCGQALRNQFRAQLFAALNVATTLLTVGLGLAAVLLMDMGIAGLLAGALAAAVVMLPLRLYSVRGLLRRSFSPSLLRALLGYGVPLVPTTLAYWVFTSSDRVMLARLSTLEQAGLYAVANGATSVLAFAVSAMSQAWSPHAIQAYEREPERAPALYGQVLTYLLVGFGVLTVGITAFAPELLRVVAAPQFQGAAAAVGPLALGYMAYASTQVTSLGISLTKRTGFFALYSWAAALLNLALNLYALPRWGMVGAAWSTMAAYVFLTLAYVVTGQRLWKVVYEPRKLVSIVVLTFAFTLGSRLLPPLGLAAGVAVKLVYCAAFGALLLACVVGPREWRLVRARLRRSPAPT